ncbi:MULTISPECIES: dioxygenase [unclassified Ruegeria]|uniref:dioxygenase family protein n=1 Tax=unclassified Ruegeria TaxID=2625375 RepID=UPI001488460C|nr:MULTISPECIES: dioxygenase [unclassified Ruegeria]NOD75908.1 hydroxyquinol 1,2-dioxygenase [Ruegeria sp. HKCCD4332]NOD88794.1 hydroxyquinol 1,2-dioxygenase [Ruegeria sp. HKCCD4318]NOE16189.1 hydroxyquinol 1,2-dioxygenase [Ruegeria sp. HKCCD4318-2]NOG09859.1 hydroxyquinol 1,2-dioxygenase [Ruegeria sp. HKCCD4315]
MRSVTKDNITNVFMGYLSKDTGPRMREIMGSLVKHLHDFARETNLTHDEWRAGIAFLEGCAAVETEDRHEFVLASDVLGLSSLVDMLHSSPDATSSSVLGPFHVSGAPPLPMGGDMKRHYGGPVLLAEGIIRDTAGNPIAGAELDIWQTAPNGLYASQDEEQDTYSFHGLMTVGDDGRYAFTTVKPVEYTVPSDGPVGDILRACGRHPWRPSHLHFIVKAPGYRSLVTEIFPDDDPYLDQDTVFGVRDDLVMTYVERPASEFPDDMALSGRITEPYLHVNFDVTLARD